MPIRSQLTRSYHRARGAIYDILHPPPKGLVSWRPSSGKRNFGDELSALVVRKMLERRGLSAGHEPSKNVLAIGSILHLAKSGDVVWGSGINGKIPTDWHRFVGLDVRAVRGPRTRQFLLECGIDCPEIFGDPAILLPRLLDQRYNAPDHSESYVIIPNLNDLDLFNRMDSLLSPFSSIRRCVARIRGAQRVLSSSLHGLVIADAFGVPAQLVLPDGHAEHLLKYQDYYEGTGRDLPPTFKSVKEALQTDPPRPPAFSASDLKRLEDAFPVEIYRRREAGL